MRSYILSIYTHTYTHFLSIHTHTHTHTHTHSHTHTHTHTHTIGSRRTQLAVFIISFLSTIFLLFHSVCMFGSSDSCTKRTMISGVESNDATISKGGTFFRSTPLNRSQVLTTVNALVYQAQLKQMAEKNEREEEQRLKEEILKSQMETNLDDIDLDNWNLEAFYDRKLEKRKSELKPEVIVKQEVEQEVTEELDISRDREEASGPEPDDDVIEDSPDWSEEPANLEPNQGVSNLEPNQEVEQNLSLKLKQAVELQVVPQGGGNPAINIETRSELNGIGAPIVLSKRKIQVGSNPINTNGGNTKTDLQLDPLITRKIREFSNQLTKNMVKNHVKPNNKKKPKKKSKPKTSKQLTLLPDSFPYYTNKHPPPLIGNYTCKYVMN